VGARTDRLQKADQVLDIVVKAEPPIQQGHVAHVVPVGDVDVVLGQHGAHRAAQQRREMARQRRHQQHPRLRGIDVLAKAQERAERRGQRGVLVHRDLAVADRDAVDPERRAGMRQPRSRNELVGGSEVAQDGVVGNAAQRLAERPQRRAGPVADRNHDIGVGLIGLVEHSPNVPDRARHCGAQRHSRLK
jgi:hypothetical protein